MVVESWVDNVQEGCSEVEFVDVLRSSKRRRERKNNYELIRKRLKVKGEKCTM